MEGGKSFLSVCCGSGIDAVAMGEKYPDAEISGIDFDDKVIQRALSRKTASDHKLENVIFKQCDAMNLPSDWSDKFDYAMSIYSIHDTGRPDLALKEIHRVLKPGGEYLMVEYSGDTNVSANKGKPFMEMLYCTSLVNCIPTAMAQREDAVGLGVIWGETTMAMMVRDAGFASVEVKPIKELDYLLGVLCKK